MKTPHRSWVWLGIVALLGASSSARAASGTWQGTTSATWALDSNWSAAPFPGTADTATFDGAGNGNTTLDLGTGVTIGTLLFDTAGAAAYTIGSGGVGAQTLTLDNTGSLTLNDTVANNQLIHAALALPTAANGNATLRNSSTAASLTLAGPVNAVPAAGNSLLYVTNNGLITVNGIISETGAGNNALLKAGAGTLVLTTNSTFNGTAAIGRIPAPVLGTPLTARQGTLRLAGGTHTVSGELVIGGVVADGGPGQDAAIQVDGATLNISSWLSIGRGNGVGGVSSDLTASNAVISAANLSAGFNGGNTNNAAKGNIALSGSSTLTITGNGILQFAESAGSDFTMTLNDSAQFIATGTGDKHFSNNGKGAFHVNSTGNVVRLGGLVYIGRDNGTGTVNIAGGEFGAAGEIRVGGTQANGAFNARGSLNISNGVVGVGAITAGRGNNNQALVSGEVSVSGGSLAITNDLILGYAGNNNFGRMAISGGTVNVGMVTNKLILIGVFDTCRGELEISSGALNLFNHSAIRFSTGNTATASTNNVITQSGGALTFFSDNGVTVGGTNTLDLQFSGSASVKNTYHLDGGTLTVPRVMSTLATGTRTFNFNGGTLRAGMDSTNFFNLNTGNARANVRNGGVVIDSNGKNVTIVQPFLHSNIAGDAADDGGLTKTGAGALTLMGTNTYTGSTTVNGGVLVAGTAGVLPATTNITVAAGATVDVSALTFVLGQGAAQTLQGSGSVLGSVNVAAGSAIRPGSSAGVLTISGALTATNASAFYFEVSTNSASGNDQVVVGGNLALGAAPVIHVSALGGAANLQAADYVLFSVAGGTTAPVLPALVYDGTQPGNKLNFTLALSGNNVVLQYSTNFPPQVTAVASPTNALHGGSYTITATVIPGSGSVTGVLVNLSSVGGPAAAPLSLSGTPNVWTNTFTVDAAAVAGSNSLPVTVYDATPLSATYVLPFWVDAGSYTWNGAGADDNYGTAANWTNGAAPASGDDIRFDGATRTTPLLETAKVAGRVTFASGAASFTVGTGNTLTLVGAGVANESPNLQTISTPVAMNTRQTFDAAAGDLALGGAVSGSGAGLVKAGAGTLTLSGTNTYPGSTTISNGTLAITGAGQLGAGNYGADVVNQGVLKVASTAAQTLSGTISGSGSLIKTNAGALTLSGTNSYGGGTTVQAGTLNINGTNAVGAGTLFLAGGTIQNSSGVNLAILNPVVAQEGTTSTLQLNGWDLTLGGNISGTGSLSVAYVGPGIHSFQLSGTNSGYTGSLTVNNNGSLRFRLLAPSVGSENASWVFNNNTADGSSLAFGNGTIHFGSFSGNGQLRQNNAGTTMVSIGALNKDDTFSGIINQANAGAIAAITKVGSGTLTLSGANAYVGGTIISNGTVHITGANLGSGTVRFSGGSLWATNSFALGNAWVVDTDSRVRVDEVSFVTVNGIVSGTAGTLVKEGAGTLVLGATNTFSGLTVVSNGQLRITGINQGNVQVAAGASLGGSGILSGTAVIESQGLLNFSNAVIDTFTCNNNVTFSNGSIYRLEAGAGSDQLSIMGGSVAASGVVTVEVVQTTGFTAGAYPIITGDPSLPAGNFVVRDDLPGYSLSLFFDGIQTLYLIVSTLSPAEAYWVGDVDTNWSTLNFGDSNWATDSSGATDTGDIPGLPTVVKLTASGAANLDMGLGADFGISAIQYQGASQTTLGGTNTLTIGSSGISVDAAAGSNSINVGSVVLGADQAWLNDAATEPLVVSSPLSGPAHLTKIGAGRIVLQGTNSISGNVLVSAGTLEISGTSAQGGNAIVNGGMLALSGIGASGGATIVSNGILRVDAASALSPSSAVTLASGSVLELRSDSDTTFSPASLSQFAGGGNSYNLRVNSIHSPAGDGRTLTLTGASGATAASAVNVNVSSTSGDTLSLGGTFALTGSGGGAWATDSVTFNLTNANVVLNGLTQSGLNGVITVNSVSGNSLTINGSVNNAGSRTVGAVLNSGVLNLNCIYGGSASGPNWGFFVTVNGGTLNVNSNNAISSSTIIVGTRAGLAINGGTLDNTSGSAKALTGNPTILLNGDFAFSTGAGTSANDLNLGTGNTLLGPAAGTTRTITVNGSAKLTLGGIIGDGATAIGLIKAGTGVLKLTGLSTNTGAMTVNAGALIASGKVGGSLAGNSTLQVGEGVAALTVGGDLTLGGAGSLNLEIATNASYDALAVISNATLGGTLNVTNLGTGYTTGTMLTVLTANAVSGTFAVTNLPALDVGQAWTVHYNAGSVVLEVASAAGPSGYDAYILQIANGQTAYQQDADGDGYANLLEYATGGNPTNADTAANMGVSRTNGLLRLQFNRSTNSIDCTLIVQSSTSLVNNAAWTGINTNSGGVWSDPGNVVETGSDPKSVVVTDPAAPTATRNLRLFVTRP